MSTNELEVHFVHAWLRPLGLQNQSHTFFKCRRLANRISPDCWLQEIM